MRSVQSEIALARPGDAVPICTVIAETWLATYINPEFGIAEEVIRSFHYEEDGQLTKANVEKTERNILELGQSDRHSIYTARVKDRVVGVSSATVSETGKRKLNVLFILPEYQGRGIGPHLRDKVLDWHGQNDIYLKVVSFNQRAIGFYLKSGFEHSGPVAEADQFVFGNGLILPEIEMVRRYSSR